MNKFTFFFLHLFFLDLSQSNLLFKWNKVLVSRLRISPGSIKETIEPGNFFYVSQKCSNHRSCTLFCLSSNVSKSSWILSDFYVSWAFIETELDQILSCYTKFTIDLVPRVYDYETVPDAFNGFPTKRAFNGIFDRHSIAQDKHEKCAKYGGNGFTITIDLLNIKKINRIIICGDNVLDTSVYIGVSKKEFYKYDITRSVDDFIFIEFSMVNSVHGQFVKIVNEGSHMTCFLCHIRIE